MFNETLSQALPLLQLTPMTSINWPVGYTFNNFGSTVVQKTGSEATDLAQAQMYSGVQGSALDLGVFFGATSHGDEDGAAISFYLKVSLESEGYIFVVQDTLYDVTTQSRHCMPPTRLKLELWRLRCVQLTHKWRS